MTRQLSKGPRLQISIIALVFFGPLLLATWMYTTGRLLPAGSTNHGELLDPVINLEEALPDSRILDEANGLWRLIYANVSDCDESCREELHRMRQIRLMLGSEMDRVGRVFLHGAASPDRVFLDNDHRGLITMSDKGLVELLKERRPERVPEGGIYLVDPLDNLVMYFSPDIDPGDVTADLEHLLELSRIG